LITPPEMLVAFCKLGLQTILPPGMRTAKVHRYPLSKTFKKDSSAEDSSASANCFMFF
jgi:hypothetical protein